MRTSRAVALRWVLAAGLGGNAATVLLHAGSAGAQGTANTATAVAAPQLAPMRIEFVQQEFATHYLAAAPPGSDVRYAWTLSPPGNDPGCNNHGVLTSDTNEFVWHHPDAADSTPPGYYSCNHQVEGPQGHLGTVAVTVTGLDAEGTGPAVPVWQCKAAYLGTSAPDGSPDYSVPFACQSLAVAAAPTTTTAPTITTTTSSTRSQAGPAVQAPGSSSGGFPAAGIVGIVVLLAVAGLGVLAVRRRAPTTPGDCDDLRARCEALRAAARAAAERAAGAQIQAAAAQAAEDRALAAVSSARQALNAAESPDEGSWVEDADTGERITEYDLHLEHQAGAAPGESTTADRAARRQALVEQARRNLGAAQEAEVAAGRAAAQAAAAARQAAADAARAESDADAACRAAEECMEELQAAAKAAQAAQDAANAKAAQNAAAARAAQEAAAARAAQAAAARQAAEREAAERAYRAAHPPPECEDGCDPKVVVETETFEMYLVWAATVEVQGAYLMSAKDVDDALHGFENFKTVVDIAEFVEGFAESGGDLAGGGPSVDTVLNVLTQSVDTGFQAFDSPNYTDPSGFAEDSVMDKLQQVIQRVNRLRSLGTWVMTCPRVKTTAICTRTYECVGGRWVLTGHRFDLQYGQKVGQLSLRWDNFDKDDVARGSADTMSRLQQQFASRNRDQMRAIAAMVRACAAPH